jgi:hypothetical protein
LRTGGFRVADLEEFQGASWATPQTTDLMGFRQWLAALDDFRNWLIQEAA